MPKHALPEVAGIVSQHDIAETVDAIASVQQPDGNIPWVPGSHTDPWNLVEAAMALDVGNRFAEAERAYEWLVSMQHDAGCWYAYYVGNDVKEYTLDTNVTSYSPTGCGITTRARATPASSKRCSRWSSGRSTLLWITNIRPVRSSGTPTLRAQKARARC
jgi:hypothetical protein